jgi:hypothetical protein
MVNQEKEKHWAYPIFGSGMGSDYGDVRIG